MKKIFETTLFLILTAVLIWLVYWANMSYFSFMIKHQTKQDFDDLKVRITVLEQNRRNK